VHFENSSSAILEWCFVKPTISYPILKRTYGDELWSVFKRYESSAFVMKPVVNDFKACVVVELFCGNKVWRYNHPYGVFPMTIYSGLQ
jgi:hypothetical protein